MQLNNLVNEVRLRLGNEAADKVAEFNQIYNVNDVPTVFTKRVMELSEICHPAGFIIGMDRFYETIRDSAKGQSALWRDSDGAIKVTVAIYLPVDASSDDPVISTVRKVSSGLNGLTYRYGPNTVNIINAEHAPNYKPLLD